MTNLRSDDNLSSEGRDTSERKSTIGGDTNELKNQVLDILKIAQEQNIDIAPNNDQWEQLAYALKNGFEKGGYAFFHDFSKLRPRYNEVETKKTWNKCMLNKPSVTTMLTFFCLAKNSLSSDKTTIRDENINYETLPKLLKDCLVVAKTDNGKRVVLFSALTAFSGIFHNIYTYYNNEKIYANFFLFIVGAPSSNKGMAKWPLKFLKQIHQYLKKEGAEIKRLIIPANNSSAGFLRLLSLNSGIGVLFETEADTIGNAFKTDFGQYDDAFRKAFHHETISSFRKKDDEDIEVNCPRLSCVLTGTPAQVHNVIYSTENGLFSRFAFLIASEPKKWNAFKNETDLTNQFEENYQKLSNEILDCYQFLETEGEMQFRLTDVQLTKFHEQMTTIYEQDVITDDVSFEASIKRFGIIFFRVAMVLTVLRSYDKGDIKEPLICSDKDFDITWQLIKKLMHDTHEVFKSLPEKRLNLRTDKLNFLQTLPYEFNKEIYEKVARDLNINVRTAEKWVEQFVKDELVVKLKHNHYHNVSLN